MNKTPERTLGFFHGWTGVQMLLQLRFLVLSFPFVLLKQQAQCKATVEADAEKPERVAFFLSES